MSDPTADTLRRTMQAIVAAAPEAPDLEPVTESKAARRARPVLVMASAFAFVLFIGAATSLLLIDEDGATAPGGGSDGGVMTSTSVIPATPIVYDPVPATWDVVAIIDADALGRDPDGVGRAVEQIGTATGVEAVAVIAPSDLAGLLGWQDGLGGGILILAGGDVSVAQDAALQARDGWDDGFIQIIYSEEVARTRAIAEAARLAEIHERFMDMVSIGQKSGPDPDFDTAALGAEMPLENAFDGVDGDTVVTLPTVFGPDADPVVYIGSVSGVDGYVYAVETDRGTTEVCQSASWVSLDTTMTGCFTFDEPGLSASFGMAQDASTGIVISVTALEDRVSVVGIELQSGDRCWQRPVAGSTMFVVFEPDALGGTAITAYGADGGTTATETFNESP